MAPSQIQIATSALQRLVKEEASYHRELVSQEKRLAKLEADTGDDDGNREYLIKQEKQAVQETKNMIPTLREKITSAREKLEAILDTATNDEERQKAIDVLKSAKEAQKDDPTSDSVAQGTATV